MSAVRVIVLGALALGLTVAAPADAAEPGPPTELWSEYPLGEPRTSASRPHAPFTPPLLPETVPQLPVGQAVPESSPTSSPLWPALLALLGLVTVAALVVASGARPAAVVQRLRPHGRRDPRRWSLPIAQHAPLLPRRPDPPALRPTHGSIRRTGLVRARFDVYADWLHGGRRRITSSRSFWRLGGSQVAERHAWIDLLRDLEADDWKLDLDTSTPGEVHLRREEDQRVPVSRRGAS